MDCDVYPAPPAAPLSVPGGAEAPIAIAERAAVDPVTGRTTMFLRVVQIRGDTRPPYPTLRLAAGSGAPTDVGPTSTPIRVGPDPVAYATRTGESDDISLIEIEILSLNQQWRLQIHNTDTREHRYVCVVADMADRTRRPWLDIPAADLSFEAFTGETTPPQSLDVANYGPGPLQDLTADGAGLGSGFTLVAIAPRVIEPSQRGTARISFTGATTGSASTSYALSSSDPAAGPNPGHNNRITLTGTSRRRPPRWQFGDLLLLKNHRLHHLNRSNGQLTEVMADSPATRVAVHPQDGAAYLLVGNQVLVRVDRSTGAQRQLSHRLVSPRDLAIDGQGTISVLGSDGSRPVVVRLDSATGQESSRVALSGEPRAIALEANGNLVMTTDRAGAPASVDRVGLLSGQQTIIASGGIDDDQIGDVGGGLAVAVHANGEILALRKTQTNPGFVVRINPRTGSQAPLMNVNDGCTTLASADVLVLLIEGGHRVLRVIPGDGWEYLLSSSGLTHLAIVPNLP
jgi:hypothetical protein